MTLQECIDEDMAADAASDRQLAIKEDQPEEPSVELDAYCPSCDKIWRAIDGRCEACGGITFGSGPAKEVSP